MQSVTEVHGRKRHYGTPNKAAPKRKHAARAALANEKARTCIGCRVADSRARLVRMVVSPEGQILFDLSGGAFGRGAWTHPTEACLKRAAKVMQSGVQKQLQAIRSDVASDPDALKRPTDSSPDPRAVAAVHLDSLLTALGEAASRRAAGLVSAANRAGHLALGGDAAKAAFAEGRARLIVLATDARSASREVWLESAVAKGLVVGWAKKSELGALFGREELAVLVITDDGLARSLREVLVLTTPVTSRLAGSRLAVARSAETTVAAGSHGLEDSEDG